MSALSYEQQQKRWADEDARDAAEGLKSRRQNRRIAALQQAKETAGGDLDLSAETTNKITERAAAFEEFIAQAEVDA